MAERTLQELTSSLDTGVQAWIPADSYADIIIQSGAKFGQLIGIISMLNYNMQACQGDILQIRYVRPRLAQYQIGGTAAHGGISQCLSAASTTVGTQSVQISKYGDYDTLPGFTEFEVCGSLRASIMEEMSRGLGRRLDKEMWTAISTGKPNGTGGPAGHSNSFACSVAWAAKPTIQSSSCCTYGFDLYNTIIRAQMHLRGDGVEPDYVIMHPTVAMYLYFREAASYPQFDTSVLKWGDDGVLKSINGLKVIECQHAAPGVTTSKATLAVVLDSRMAVAEAWGKRPTFSRDYVNECDYTKEVLWAYWGCAAISGASETGICNAIAHVINP